MDSILYELRLSLEKVGLYLRTSRESRYHQCDYFLVGDTFPNQDVIQINGGKWNRDREAWQFTSINQIKRLLENINHAGRNDDSYVETTSNDELLCEGKVEFQFEYQDRDRMKSRFDRLSRLSLDSIEDDELIEMLVYGISKYNRSDSLSKCLMSRFQGLGAILGASPRLYDDCLVGLRIEPCPVDRYDSGVEDVLAPLKILFPVIGEVMKRALRERVKERPVIGSWTALMDYLQLAMQHETAEHFRILFLDRKNILIRDEVQSRGTVDHTPLYPREVVKRALELAASAVIMVHNHPSGDPTPSQADIDMTRQVAAALQLMGIAVHDHIIVGKNRHTSFRSQKLI